MHSLFFFCMLIPVVFMTGHYKKQIKLEIDDGTPGMKEKQIEKGTTPGIQHVTIRQVYILFGWTSEWNWINEMRWSKVNALWDRLSKSK